MKLRLKNTILCIFFTLLSIVLYVSCFNYAAKERVIFENASLAELKKHTGSKYIDPGSSEVKKILVDGKVLFLEKMKIHANKAAFALAFALFLFLGGKICWICGGFIVITSNDAFLFARWNI